MLPLLVFRVKAYIRYLREAKTAHGVHSPFVFRLIKEVIEPSRKFQLPSVEEIRSELKKNHHLIDLYDLKSQKNYRTTLSSVAKSSLSTRRFSAFLYKLIDMLQVEVVLETGTNLGINSFYLAGPVRVKQVITLEASPILAALAKEQFGKLLQHKVLIKEGLVQETFKPLLIKYQPAFIFLDADHRKEVVLKQVDEIMECLPHVACIAIHDIYWSAGMNGGWEALKKDKRFPLSIDIFQAGLLFPNQDMPKQHFTLRF